ncbi:hypothetical protein BU52_07850 [Streptomyces toyocaensis]|uniref:Uncharacterized protein n=1 Tax=Streptomyces toyocaensis TaxID=55952 RepID=A0A081XWA3_STRTO|nr:hypothetical protein BU52_07850 [Streptomyces toyocaensis]
MTASMAPTRNSAAANRATEPGQAGGQCARARQQRAEHGDTRGPQPAGQHPRRRTGHDGTRGERRDGQSVDGVADAEVVLDLRVARQQVGEQGAVGEEQHRHGRTGPPVGPGGLPQYVNSHAGTL